jgi:hypothetical protein
MDLNLFAGLIAVHDDRMKQTNCRNADHQPLGAAFIERELASRAFDDLSTGKSRAIIQSSAGRTLMATPDWTHQAVT